MKIKTEKRPVLGDERKYRMFLLFPKKLGLDSGYDQTRWLGFATVIQSYDGEKWISIQWEVKND